MEFLNRIELRGNIGSVRTNTYGGRSVANFTVATGRAFKSSTGDGIIETTWHNVTAWQGRDIADFSRLEKGQKVYVVGRLNTRKFTGDDGVERMAYDVIATRLEIIEESGAFAYEA